MKGIKSSSAFASPILASSTSNNRINNLRQKLSGTMQSSPINLSCTHDNSTYQYYKAQKTSPMVEASHQPSRDGGLKLFLDTDPGEKHAEQNDITQNKMPSKSKELTNESSMKEILSKQNHYKIIAPKEGVKEEARLNEEYCQEEYTEEQDEDGDLEGWLEKQIAMRQQFKLQGTSQVEEEAKKEIQKRLLNDDEIQDSPEVDIKILNSILRESPVNKFTKTKGVLQCLKLIGNMNNKKKNNLFDSAKEQRDSVVLNKADNIHVGTATSADLLRLYKPKNLRKDFIANWELEKRCKTQELILRVAAGKVIKEQKGSACNTEQSFAIGRKELEKDDSVERLVRTGKEKAKVALKTFKGLSDMNIEKSMSARQILKTIDTMEEQVFKINSNLNSHKKQMINSHNQIPFSEIIDVYLSKYNEIKGQIHSIKNKQKQIRLDTSILVESIHNKEIEFTQIVHNNDIPLKIKNALLQQINQENESDQSLNNIFTISSNNKNDFSSITNLHSYNNSYSSNSHSHGNGMITQALNNRRSLVTSQMNSEYLKEKRRKEMIVLQLKDILQSIRDLKLELQQYQESQNKLEKRLAEQKTIKCRLSKYIKDQLINMMKNDLSLYVAPSKPVNLSLPLIGSIILSLKHHLYQEYYPTYLQKQSKLSIIQMSKYMFELDKLTVQMKSMNNNHNTIGDYDYDEDHEDCDDDLHLEKSKRQVLFLRQQTQYSEDTNQQQKLERMKTDPDKEKLNCKIKSRLELEHKINECQHKLNQIEQHELLRIQENVIHLQKHAHLLQNTLVSIFGLVKGTQQYHFYLQFKKFRGSLLCEESKITNKEKREFITNAKTSKLLRISFNNTPQDNSNNDISRSSHNYSYSSTCNSNTNTINNNNNNNKSDYILENSLLFTTSNVRNNKQLSSPIQKEISILDDVSNNSIKLFHKLHLKSLNSSKIQQLLISCFPQHKSANDS